MSRKQYVDEIVVQDLGVMFVQGGVDQLVLVEEHGVEDGRETVLE